MSDPTVPGLEDLAPAPAPAPQPPAPAAPAAAAPASDSEDEASELQPFLPQDSSEEVGRHLVDPIDSATVPLLDDTPPTPEPIGDAQSFVEISPVIRPDKVDVELPVTASESPVIAVAPQTQPDAPLVSLETPSSDSAPESLSISVEAVDLQVPAPVTPDSDSSSTPEKPPLIESQDDTPASAPLSSTPPEAPQNSPNNNFHVVDLSIAEDEPINNQVDDSSTPATLESKEKRLDTLKRNLKSGSESLKKGSESVGNTLRRQSSQVGESLKKGGTQVGSSLKRGGEQVGHSLRRGTSSLRENLSHVNLPKPDLDAAKHRIAKAKPKKERNEHYCNCFRGIMLMSIDDLKSPLFWRAAIAEFVGTMILTMVGCGSCIGYVPETDLVRIALGFGLIVTTVVWGIGHVSGGHVNPAVTMAMVATRRISMARAFFYIIMQLCGAVVGAGILKGVTPESLDSNLGATLLANGMKTVGENQVAYVINPGQGFGIEFFITFILVFTVFATCDSKRNDHNGSSALAIGLSVAVCHLWAVPATGSSMNTARSFGPAVVAGEWKDHWVYWVGPILGGIAAGFVYDHVFAANSSKQKFRTCVLGAEYEGDDFDAVVEKPRKIVESEDDFIEPKSLKEEQV